MTPSQLYIQETQNGKLKAEIKEMLSSKALSRYEAEELIQLNVLNEIERPRKIYSSEIKKIKENHNMTAKEKLDTISHLYTNNGFEVVDRDRLKIKLFKKKKFSFFSAFLWFLLLGVGLVIYILYYLFKGDNVEIITVEDNYKEKPQNMEEEVEFESSEEVMEDELENSSVDIDQETQEIAQISEDKDNVEKEELSETFEDTDIVKGEETKKEDK